jgi:hypothetical protein
MVVEIDRTVIHERQDTYLTDHYLTAHTTAVSVALGVAGISAASLISPAVSLRPYQQLLWLLWLLSLLTTATAYAATTTGAIVLPARMPAITDLLLPLLLSMSEFLLFGMLASQVTSLSAPRLVLEGWWLAMAAYGLLAFLSVSRAHCLIQRGSYSSEIQPIIDRYLRRQRRDMVGTGLTATMAVSVAIYYLLLAGNPLLDVSFALTLPLVVLSLLALFGVSLTARELRKSFVRVPTS